MVKKVVSIILILMMSLGIFAGCGQKKNTGKLTVGIPQDATIPNYNENAFCKYLEQASGVDIEWVYFASSAASAQQQLTLMCTGGEKLPDVLLGFQGMGHYVVNQFGEDGFIVDLTELIDKYGVNYKKQLENLPEDTRKVLQEKMVNTNNGEIYSLPLVTCPAIDGRQSLVYINQTWLNNLNLEIPTTVEELYDVLVAFATEDPNQNGDNDEIPMLAEAQGYNYLINAFIQYQSGAFYVEDGKICDATKTTEFREAMKYINKLVTEGLYSELSFSIGDAEYKSLLSPTDEVSKVGIFGGHHESMTDATTNTLSNYTALPSLQDATGSGKGGYTLWDDYQILYTTYITKDCKDQEKAMKLLDTFFLDETVSRMRHGEKDVDWVYEEGKNAYGTDSYVKIINGQAFFDGSLNKCTHNWLGILTHWNYLPLSIEGEGRDADASRLQREQWEVIQAGKFPEERTGELTYTMEEYEIREKYNGNMLSALSEDMVLFMTGGKNPSDDAQWNAFLKRLDDFGREEIIKTLQSAYSRKSDK